MLPMGVSKTGMVEPSPWPQTRRSEAVGISLRCLPMRRSGGIEEEHRAIERAAVALDDADDQVDAVFPGDIGQSFDGGAGDLDRRFEVAAEEIAAGFGARADDRAERGAAGIGGDERFREEDQLGALRAGLGGEGAGFVEGLFQIERDRRGLDDGDAGGLVFGHRLLLHAPSDRQFFYHRTPGCRRVPLGCAQDGRTEVGSISQVRPRCAGPAMSSGIWVWLCPGRMRGWIIFAMCPTVNDGAPGGERFPTLSWLGWRGCPRLKPGAHKAKSLRDCRRGGHGGPSLRMGGILGTAAPWSDAGASK